MKVREFINKSKQQYARSNKKKLLIGLVETTITQDHQSIIEITKTVLTILLTNTITKTYLTSQYNFGMFRQKVFISAQHSQQIYVDIKRQICYCTTLQTNQIKNFYLLPSRFQISRGKKRQVDNNCQSASANWLKFQGHQLISKKERTKEGRNNPVLTISYSNFFIWQNINITIMCCRVKIKRLLNNCTSLYNTTFQN